ncbi:MAG: cobalamin-dependent protein [Desulforhabdus sp.]|jgi:5-methyltetrahydrofolate--homocysteine methyltransferase|nr:cobalamin-dependent protein [Desulforhabdus sp.]
MNSIRQLESAIVKGNTRKAVEITEQCLEEGLSPATIISQGILKGLDVVGEKWKSYEYFIPNILVSAMATKVCFNVLRPAFGTSLKQPVGKAVAGTVEGDVHDIGKNIVIMFMQASGFEVIDLGVDVVPEQFVRMVKREKPDLLLLSCLYTLTMHAVEDTIIALRKAGLKGKVKTLIGGAPITQRFADSIGADGFGVDAIDGIKKAAELLKLSDCGAAAGGEQDLQLNVASLSRKC